MKSHGTLRCFLNSPITQANEIIPKQLRNAMMISSQINLLFSCDRGSTGGDVGLFGRLWHVWPVQRSVIDWRSSRRAVCSSSYSSSILPRHFLLFFLFPFSHPPERERECLRPFDYNPLLYISPSSAPVPHLTYSLLFTNFLFKTHLQFLKSKISRAFSKKKKNLFSGWISSLWN